MHEQKKRDPTMGTYNDLFIRDALNDTGVIPYAGGIAYQSPDILPAGTSPVTDPQTYFTNNYSQFWNANIEFGAYNYIYVRVKNLSSASTTGQVALYYVPSNIFSTPAQWVGNTVPNANGTNLGSFPTVASGAIGVVQTPFYWNPPTQPSGYHYCLLAQVITTADPNPIPVTDDPLNFSAWIRGDGGSAFRNVTIVDNQPNTGQQWLVDMANPDTTESQLFVVVAQCTNVPLNSTIGMVSPTIGPTPPVNYSETITNATSQNVTTSTTLPASFQGELVVTYTPSASAPTAQVLVQYYIAGTPDVEARADAAHFRTTPAALGLDHERLGLDAAQTLILLGDYTWATGPAT
jgi:hypothetical protein